jgi:DNA-binding protein HU-beta
VATKTKKTAAKKVVKKIAKPVKKVAKVQAKPEPKKNIPVPPKKPVLITPRNGESKQYTQSEFFECVKGYCGFNTRSEAKNFYGSFASMLQSALKSGFKLVLPGLGKMQVKRTKPRIGRNPATGEAIQIPAKKKVAFTPLKVLKTSVL